VLVVRILVGVVRIVHSPLLYAVLVGVDVAATAIVCTGLIRHFASERTH
jgi:hypothetical protein